MSLYKTQSMHSNLHVRFDCKIETLQTVCRCPKLEDTITYGTREEYRSHRPLKKAYGVYSLTKSIKKLYLALCLL